ncbi:FecR family protein [Chitinophaga lutea]
MSQLLPDEALYSLLCKYLLHEADEVEREWVETWRKGRPENEAALSAIRRMLETPAPVAALPGLDTESSWQRLRGALTDEGASSSAGAVADGEQRPDNAGPAVVKPLRKRLPWPAIAATALVLIAAAAWLLRPQQPARTFQGGQTALLDDGSRIDIRPGAVMEVAGRFGQGERRVHFSGKGTFDVAPNPQAPFIVQLAGNMEIRVLGTRFSVDYGAGSALTIHVESGRILVHTPGTDDVPLTAGMLLRRPAPGAPVAVAENIADLERKHLVFRDVPLRKALPAIEAVYGVRVEVPDTALLDKKVNADFADAPLEEVMQAIAYMTNTTADKNGQQYTIH